MLIGAVLEENEEPQPTHVLGRIAPGQRCVNTLLFLAFSLTNF